MKRQLGILLTAALPMATAAVALGEIPAIYSFSLREIGIGGTPVILDTANGHQGYNPYYRGSQLTCLGFRRETGRIGAHDTTGGGLEVHTFDTEAEYAKGATGDAGIGTIKTYNTSAGTIYSGSVGGTLKIQLATVGGVSYDPYMTTGDHTGVWTATRTKPGLSAGERFAWAEFVVQTAAEGVGQ